MKNKIKNIFTIGLFACLLSGCTDSFVELNKNPLASSSLNPELVFPFVTWKVTNIAWDNYQLGDQLGVALYAQYIANTSTGYSVDRYVYEDAYPTGGLWGPHYTGVMKNIKMVGSQITENPHSVQTYQLMRIILAYSSAKMTDIYGDMPYSEAGINIEQPKYDSQKDIYNDVFKELREAVEVLQSGLKGQNALGNSDFIYNGDVSKWIKFANSIRLRCAIRLSFIDPEKARQEGEAALAAGVMSSIDDGATCMTNKDDWNSLGYPLITISHWGEFRVSATLVDILENTGTVVDPRETLYIGKTKLFVTEGKGDAYKGVPNGLPADQLAMPGYTLDENSNVHGMMFFPNWNTAGVDPTSVWITKRYPVMRYSEVCFLKAEAALRGWNGAGNAKDNYEEGIRTSFAESRDGIDTKLLDLTKDETYITTGNVAWDVSGDFESNLKKIITQKWIALYPVGAEAWAEFRRTGYPDLKPIVRCDDSNIKPGEFIKKIYYPDEERRINMAHATDKSLNNGKGDGGHVRVWWDTGRCK
ncbi:MULTISPECIES: SusD/RagB family nutrient-binding outer membrane lipoprotein [Parabacteroides]|uniref:SusD/RagB family nutrient-binding outer membrane lipoprotein n=1 Tax=Parabacteroides provencensis TaxID=1944636 RepID=UPI000C15A50C|nr:SusD/RagB family nutrient-binding outer membrane lipoprotein [Parabacteroides provencensis]